MSPVPERPDAIDRRTVVAGVAALAVCGDGLDPEAPGEAARKETPVDEGIATQAVIEALKARAMPAVMLEDRGSGSLLRLGGLPRLGDHARWPHRNGRPLSFLAQLDLAAVRQTGGPDWLPSTGFLHLFYDAEDQPWGFDPADRDGWVLLATDAVADAVEPPPPGLADEAVFEGRALGGRAALTYPTPERLDLPQDIVRGWDVDTVFEFIDHDLGDGPRHQVGGYPSPIQGDGMELEAQLASNGLYMGGPDSYGDARIAALAPGAADWRLLLQLDSDDDAGMMWGDGGRLYVWVREQDARAGDFSRIWIVLQCL